MVIDEPAKYSFSTFLSLSETRSYCHIGAPFRVEVHHAERTYHSSDKGHHFMMTDTFPNSIASLRVDINVSAQAMIDVVLTQDSGILDTSCVYTS